MEVYEVTIELERTAVLMGFSICIRIDDNLIGALDAKTGGWERVKLPEGEHKLHVSTDRGGLSLEKSLLIRQNGVIRLGYDKSKGRPSILDIGPFDPNKIFLRGEDKEINLDEEDIEKIKEIYGRKPSEAYEYVRIKTDANLFQAKRYVDNLVYEETESNYYDNSDDFMLDDDNAVDDPVSFYEYIANLSGSSIVFTRKEINHLWSILLENEVVNAVTSGLMNGRTWLLAATNKRVILINKNMFIGMQQSEIPINQINSISYVTGLMFSSILIAHGSSSIVIENVKKGTERFFVEATNNAIREYSMNVNVVTTQTPLASQNFSVADEIKKFKELLDMGVLTQEEFDAKKRQLLNL